MRKIISLVLLGLTGCAQLMHGAEQTVSTVDYKNQVYKTTCSGLADTWGDCFARARKTCEKGYQEISRIENPSAVRRELTFQCKK